MISETVQAAFAAANITAYQLEAVQNAEPPFVVYGLATQPVQTKGGPAIYTSVLSVYCANRLISGSVSAGNSVIDALQNIQGIRFTDRETSAEGEEGKPPIYIETVKFTIKHQQP